MPGLYNFAVITADTDCITCQWVKQWWNSWTRGFFPSQNDSCDVWHFCQPRMQDDFTGYKTLSNSGNHERSHQISWKQPFYLLKCDWLTLSRSRIEGGSAKIDLYCNDSSFLQWFYLCIFVPMWTHWGSIMTGITLIDAWACKEGLCIL